MIQVLIERYIADDMLSTYEENAKHALHRTYVAPGFIAGETLVDINAPNHRFLLCKWRSLRDWRRWYQSDDRQELMNKIAPVLQEPEKITVLEN
jgi:heme-degrading monooxygenase HmoA